MKFKVSADVFARLDGLCFGVVVARGINNRDRLSEIESILEQSMELVQTRFKGVAVKEQAEIMVYREAFVKLGFNPNKFLSSVEAMVSRIAKGHQLPVINNIVDLTNAVSLKYIIPMGAHDLDKTQGDIEVRFSEATDIFLPFGAGGPETPEPGELVYASGNSIKTRRWIWRQSEEGKITEASTNIFFPLDGFKESNDRAVLTARDELAVRLDDLFKCDVKTGWVDKDNPVMEL
jgi:DNA/RNA-binding domain of Phe-tRNA-synthetase-like protein